MATRPSWRGYMRLSLVSCPVRPGGLHSLCASTWFVCRAATEECC